MLLLIRGARDTDIWVSCVADKYQIRAWIRSDEVNLD